MKEYFHQDEKILTKKEGLLKKYSRRAVGSERISDLLLYEFLELFVMWIPGALGFAVRGLLLRLLFKETGGKNYFSSHITVRGGKKITIGSSVFIDSYVTLDVKDVKAKGIEIGSGTFIERFSVISSGIGENGYVKIGDNCSIGCSVNIFGHGGAVIGNNVMIASHTCIIASSHVFSDTERPMFDQGHLSKGIVIEDDVWLGAGSKVLDGIRIGRGSIIGAGSVVTSDIEPYSIAVGVPAKVIKKRE